MSDSGQLRRKYWGWGYEGFELTPDLLQLVEMYLVRGRGLQLSAPREPLPVEAIELPPSRFEAKALADVISSAPRERASHAMGKSFRDVWRALRGRFPHPPDHVAFPRNENDLAEVIEFCDRERVALVPYGGGSSVVGGVEPAVGGVFNGALSVDLRHFDRVLEIDDESRAARIQGGVYGPALEDQLRGSGLTLRHFPQSFEFSTLGGWIATRAGGHFATLYTHVDEFVESVRMVTPRGVMATRRLPGHGAGPSEERLVCGSEGSLGIITEAWMRLQNVPVHRAGATFAFETFTAGAAACRALAQSGLYPSNARLVDKGEAVMMGLGDGRAHMLMVAFESHDHPLDAWLERAVQLCSDCGGRQVGRNSAQREPEAGSEQWKAAFLRAPYLRDELLRRGLVVETFETAVTWDRFEAFHEAVRGRVRSAIAEICGAGFVTCRFTHLYPDGPAPYYTVLAQGREDAELGQWDAIKAAVSDVIIEEGGTITHHHAVGRDHAAHWRRQATPVFQDMLAAAKGAVDPSGIMNPGVLLPVAE